MMMKNIILAITFVCCLNAVQAQTGNMPGGLDGGKYTPKNNPDASKTKKSNAGLDIEKNAISFSLAHLIRQTAVLSYERTVGSRFAIKASGGYCFGKDLTQNLLSITDANENVHDLNYYNENYTFAQKTNYYADITGKFYSNLSEAEYYDLLYRFYVGLSYRNYRQTFLKNSSDNAPAGIVDLPVTNRGTSLVVGQMVYNASGMTLEYYLGLGRLSSSYHTFTRDANYNYNYDAAKTKDHRMFFTFGVVYGFSF